MFVSGSLIYIILISDVLRRKNLKLCLVFKDLFILSRYFSETTLTMAVYA